MLTVSNYHYIRENFTAKYPSIFGVTPDMFKRQLLLLKDKADFVSAMDLITNGEEILNSKNNYCLITFDDGLKEQFENALPILDELGIHALFFVNSINHIEKKVSLVHKIHLVRSIISSHDLHENLMQFAQRKLTAEEIQKAHKFYRFDDKESAEVKYFLNIVLDFTTQDKFINSIFENNFSEKEVLENLYMNTNEVQQLIKRGYVGSHSHSHLPLGIYDNQTIRFELDTTKKYLEDLGGLPINFVSYPYGTETTATETVGKIAEQVGHKYGFTTKPQINDEFTNPLLLNRFDCNELIGGKNYQKKL